MMQRRISYNFPNLNILEDSTNRGGRRFMLLITYAFWQLYSFHEILDLVIYLLYVPKYKHFL